MTIRGPQADPTIEVALEGLAVHDTRPERVERVRALCLSALERHRRQATPKGPAAVPWRARLELAVAAGLAAVYVAGALERALEILR